LSRTIARGKPRALLEHAHHALARDRATAIASASRLKSRTRFSVRNVRPSASVSAMKSIDQRSFARVGTAIAWRGDAATCLRLRRCTVSASTRQTR
jgi:hypothetical protein